MATTDVKTSAEYKADLAVYGGLLINPNPDPQLDPPLNPQLYPKLKVPFVPCADLLLARATADPEIKVFYDHYFSNLPHNIFTNEEFASFTCTSKEGDNPITDGILGISNGILGCLPRGCTTLWGIRGSASYINPAPAEKIGRLFVGDLVWLYWMERMGLFEMQAKLVNDFAIEGRFPINNNYPIAPINNSIDNSNMTPITLEIMTRQFQSGITSLTRDRVSTYRRCLGWTTPIGRKMELHTEVNSAFTSQFHLFIKTALEYYKDLRLATAIQQTVGGGSSASTRVAVAEALQLLKESFVVFGYGRNNYNTLNGIVNAIATLNIIRTVKDELAIPSSFIKASQYVSAAYAMLIEGKSASAYKPNRYLLHKDCAEKARDLLNDIVVLKVDDVDAVGLWLENKIVEEQIETYRKAYRDLTKVDLAVDIEHIEQQV